MQIAYWVLWLVLNIFMVAFSVSCVCAFNCPKGYTYYRDVECSMKYAVICMYLGHVVHKERACSSKLPCICAYWL